jgi:hypothetical protein
MGTVLLVVIALAVVGGIIYFLQKSGKIEDKNNNNIPDVVEDKIEEAKVAVKEVKAKAKKVVSDVTTTAKKVAVEAEKISAKAKTKKTSAKK